MKALNYSFLAIFCGLIALAIGTGSLPSMLVSTIGLIFAAIGLIKSGE